MFEALVAALPIFVLLFLIGVKRKVAWIASLAGLRRCVAVTPLCCFEARHWLCDMEDFNEPKLICEYQSSVGYNAWRLGVADEGRSYYTFDGRTLDASASKLIDGADRAMRDLGYAPVGDVVGSYFSSTVQRGNVKKGGDTWAKFVFEACSSSTCSGYWEFMTMYENGVLVTTRAAMTKDEPKRKIYGILDPKSPPRDLLAKHEKRRVTLVAKCGATIPVKADLHSLAAECEASIRRFIG